jgi:hypothetical protein
MNVVDCHPERSAAESKDPVELLARPPGASTGSLDYARDDNMTA